MATAAGNENEDTDSLTQESDEIQEMYCEHCEKELGTIVKADGFCVECKEYLCSTCLRYHKKYVPNHILQDSANMPQDFYFEKCKIHTKELTKFYCTSCDQTACLKCKTVKHKNCTVDHIPTLVGSTDIRKEVHQINLPIDQSLEQLATSRDNINLKLAEVNSNRADASASIKERRKTLEGIFTKKFQLILSDIDRKHNSSLRAHCKRRDDLIAQLDKEEKKLLDNHRLQQEGVKEEQLRLNIQLKQAEEELNNDSEKRKQTDELKLQTLLSKANKTREDLTELKKNFQATIRTEQKSKVFLAAKTVRKDIAKLKIATAKATEVTEIDNYEFQPSSAIPSRADAFLSFGSFKEKCKRRKLLYQQLLPISLEPKSYTYITGMCKLSDFLLVAADNNNASLKLIDISTDKLSSTFHLEDKPFGVTKMEDNELAATLPDVGKIQFLSIIPSIKLFSGPRVAVKKNCHGIVYKKPNLIVSFNTYQGEVQIMDKEGTILKNFSHPLNPVFIALGKNNSILYIYTKLKIMELNTLENLTKMSTDGEVIATKPMNNANAVGLAVDKVGTIYVCCASSNDIIQISADFQTEYVIPMPSQHVASMPSSMFYCNKERQLYVATGKGIYVYKVE